MSSHLPPGQFSVVELDQCPDCEQLQDALERLTVRSRREGLQASVWVLLAGQGSATADITPQAGPHCC